MKPVETLLKSSARWFLVVLALGVWLRSAFVWLYNPRPFTWGDLIHAHSHTAYFGWAGLGVMGLVLYVLPRLTGRPLKTPRQMKWLLWLAPWAVGGSLVTFALWGYAGPSIAFSTLNEVLWFWFAWVFWVNVRGRKVAEWPAALWLLGAAVLMLLVSTLGTVLVVLFRVVFPVSDGVLGNAGIYLFLQAYGDGWLELGIMGVAAALTGGLSNRRMAAWLVWLAMLTMVPATLRLLVPFGVSGWLETVGAVAGAGLSVAQALYLANMVEVRHRLPAVVRPWWLLAAGALALKAAMELLPLVPGWEGLAGDRNLVIAFLHLKLLTLVSAGLIGALGYLGAAGRGFWAYAVGAVVMLAALGAVGFWGAASPLVTKASYAVAFAGAVVAAAGAYGAVWPMAVGHAPEGRPAGDTVNG